MDVRRRQQTPDPDGQGDPAEAGQARGRDRLAGCRRAVPSLIGVREA